MQKLAVVLFFLMLCSMGATAQKKPGGRDLSHCVRIVFDPDGRMIGFPPPVIRQHATLQLSVKVPLSFLQKETGGFTDALAKTLKKLNDPSLDPNLYNCIMAVKLDEYKNQLDLAAKVFKDLSFCDKKRSSPLQEHKGMPLVPVDYFLRNMLDSQYEMRIYNGSVCVDSQYLHFTTGSCKDGCITLVANSHVIVKKLMKGNCISCPTTQLQFKLIHHDPYNNTVVQWFAFLQRTNKWDGKQFAQHYERMVSSHSPADSCKYYDSVETDLRAVKQWITAWLWFNGGELQTNPFPTEDVALIRDWQSKIATLEAHEKKLQELQKFNDSCKVKLKTRDRNYGPFIDLQRRGDSLTGKLKDDSSAADTFQKLIDSSKAKLVDKIARTTKPLYSGTILLSKVGSVQVQKQFNAAKDFQAIYRNRSQKERISEIPENEKAYIIIQNADSSLQVKLDEKRQPFDDTEESTMLINEQLSRIDFSSIPAANLQNLSAFLEGFAPGGKGASAPPETKGLVPAKDSLQGEKSCPCARLDFIAGIYTQVKNEKPVITKEDVFEKRKLPELKPVYSSQVNAATIFETPYRDSITIIRIVKKDSTKDVAKTFIKVGKLRYIQLAAGIAFLRQHVSTNSIDTTGNGFRVNSTDRASAAVFGFKLYPIKNYNRDNGILPRYPFRRLSIFGGFDITHPLNDLYVGLGYDVIPGIAFIVGDNFYLQTRYQVENNQIINSAKAYKSGGAFYSVTVNPTVFVQFVKLFFK